MASTSTRPNILFIFADDWGWGDLGCYGHRHVRTPHLDRLAAEGTLFSQFYVCSGVCSPSRAAMMTGRFPARFGIHGHFATHERNAARGMPNWLDPAATTITGLFQQSGFRVGHFGKWHLGNGSGAPPPTAYGIDEFDEPRCPIVYTDPSHTGTRATSSQEIVDQAIGFLEQGRDRPGGAAEPFFLNLWLYDTHASLDPNEEHLERYVDYMPLHVPHAGATAIYYATVTEADLQIGRLLAKLDELGLADDTLVVFSADNGPEDMEIRNSAHSGIGSAGPFRGRKRSLYEGGVRVPFILRWPGNTPAGVVNDATPLCAVDLLPTFCELAGVTYRRQPGRGWTASRWRRPSAVSSAPAPRRCFGSGASTSTGTCCTAARCWRSGTATGSCCATRTAIGWSSTASPTIPPSSATALTPSPSWCSA